MALLQTEVNVRGIPDIRGRLEASFRILALAAFGVLITVGCVLRFWKLSDVGLWYDELWTVVGASDRSFMEMYREWILGDAHPPGYFLFYFVWFKIVPNTEFWARIPNAVAGVMTVAYLLFRTGDVLTRDERVVCASLASLSFSYILYALSVKQYSAVILFTTIATVTYLRIVKAHRVERRAGITMAAACLALAYLNYFAMVYGALLLALLALTFRRNRAELRRILSIAIVCGLACLPIAHLVYIQLRYATGDWQSDEVVAFGTDVLASLFFDYPAYVKRALAILFGLVLVLAVTRRQTRRELWRSRNRHLVLIVMAFGGFMLALGLAKPIFFVRYFLVMFPAVLLGLGILTIAAFPIERGWLAILPLAFFFTAAESQFRSIDALQRQQWDKSVDFVLEARTPNDPIFVLGANMDKTAFEYLREGDVDGVYYVRNLNFYDYYFKRRGAHEIAAKLEVVEPTVASVKKLALRFRDTGTTIYILAGHHIQYDGHALATLEHVARKVEIEKMYSTLVYKVRF